jgi:hypothetical protein
MYSKKYYETHKKEILFKQKEYRQKNKSKIVSSSREYYIKNKIKMLSDRKKKFSSFDGIQIRKKYNKTYYTKHKNKINQKCMKRYYERKLLIDKIALHYNCMNSNCGWNIIYRPSQLDFHHLDQNNKDINVSQITCCSIKKIVTEINKCVVLCRNCHALVHEGIIKVDASMLCKVNCKLSVIT